MTADRKRGLVRYVKTRFGALRSPPYELPADSHLEAIVETIYQAGIDDARSTTRVKTHSLSVEFKDPDGIGELIHAFKLKNADDYFEFSEYATLDLVVDKNMNLTGCIRRRT